MRIEIRHHYDASPATVHAMLSDPAFWQFALAGQVESFAVEPAEQGLCLKLGVKSPSQVRAFTGDTMSFTLQATWLPDGDNAWSGPLAIDAGKMPGSFTGSTHIGPSDGGAEVLYSGDFTIRVPIVGKNLEQKAVPYVTGVLNGQQAKGVAWLADHGY